MGSNSVRNRKQVDAFRASCLRHVAFTPVLLAGRTGAAGSPKALNWRASGMAGTVDWHLTIGRQHATGAAAAHEVMANVAAPHIRVSVVVDE